MIVNMIYRARKRREIQTEIDEDRAAINKLLNKCERNLKHESNTTKTN